MAYTRYVTRERFYRRSVFYFMRGINSFDWFGIVVWDILAQNFVIVSHTNCQYYILLGCQDAVMNETVMWYTVFALTIW